MTDLKPCPFCGGTDVRVGLTGFNASHDFALQWCVICYDCHTEGPVDLGESGAVEKWNTRPAEAELAKERYADLIDVIRHTPSMAQDTADTLQRILIGGEQPHACAHCKQLFTADNIAEHMHTCESNPVVLENQRLRAEVTRLSSDQDAAQRIAADYHKYDMTKEYVASKMVIDRMQDENDALRARIAELEAWWKSEWGWWDTPEDDAMLLEIAAMSQDELVAAIKASAGTRPDLADDTDNGYSVKPVTYVGKEKPGTRVYHEWHLINRDGLPPYTTENRVDAVKSDGPLGPDWITDGHGTWWAPNCPNCGAPMQVMRPGFARCAEECYLKDGE